MVRDRGETVAVAPFHPSSPRPVQQNRPDADDDEKPTDARADDVETVANGFHAIPQTPLEATDILDQGEKLDDANKSRNEDGDAREDDRVIQNGNVVAGESLGGVEGHHEGAVGRVEHAHTRCRLSVHGFQKTSTSPKTKATAYR